MSELSTPYEPVGDGMADTDKKTAEKPVENNAAIQLP